MVIKKIRAIWMLGAGIYLLIPGMPFSVWFAVITLLINAFIEFF